MNMPEKYLDDIIEILSNNKQCNFLALCLTPLHVNGVEATIRRLLDNGEHLEGYILLGTHDQTGRTVTKDMFSLKGSGFTYLDFRMRFRDGRNTNSLLDKIRALYFVDKTKAEDKFFVVYTTVDYHWVNYLAKSVLSERRIYYVRIDDGGGSYADPVKDAYRFAIYNGKKGAGIIHRILVYSKIRIRIMYENLFTDKLIRNKQFLDNRLFTVNNFNHITGVNEDAKKYYIYGFEKSVDMSDRNDLLELKDSILINTQCLQENQIISNDIDFQLYREIVKCLQKKKIKVVIKPHPRELNPGKYKEIGAYIISSSVTQESLLSYTEYNPKCIISIFSSTLLNAKGLFGVPSISLAKIVAEMDISSVLKTELFEYYEQYKDIIAFPESMNKLLEYIDNL